MAKKKAKRRPPKKSSLAALREGVCRATAYNDGLTVFLYDASQRSALAHVDIAEVIEQHYGVDELEQQYREISVDAQLVAYELEQDDEINIDVAVGAPLNDEERSTLGVGEAQQTLLKAPTGQLRVESYNSLNLGKSPGEEVGARVDVPAADYTLSLYRKDFSGWSDSKLERYRGPLQIVILTPTDELSPPDERRAYLPWLPPAGAPDWVGDWQIDDGGVFHGRFIIPIGINLDRPAAQRMRLRAGTRLRLETDDWSHEAIYLPGAGIEFAPAFAYGTAAEVVHLVASLKPNRQAGVETLDLWYDYDNWNTEEVQLHREFFEAWRAEVEKPVRVTVKPPPFFPAPDPAALDRWAIEDGILHTEVITSTCAAISFSADRRAFETLRIDAGDPLLLEIGDLRRTLYYLPTWEDVCRKRSTLCTGHSSRSFVEIIEDDQPMCGYLRRHWEFRNKYVFWCEELSPNYTTLSFTAEAETSVTIQRRV